MAVPKTKKIKGKKTTIGKEEGTHITIKGPDTYRTDLKDTEVDKFVAPKVKKVKKVAKKAYSKAKKKVKEFIKKPRTQSTKYRVGDSGNVRKVKKYPGMGS